MDQGVAIARRVSRKLMVGRFSIGGDSPILIQSMTKTDTRDVLATIRQIKALKEVGCEIVRVAVPDMDAARALGKIKEGIDLPLVADIHFDHHLALEAIRQGVDKVRINPYNIKSLEGLKEVVLAAKRVRIPIRIGINSGSIKLRRYHHITPEALVDSALEYIRLFEELGFFDIIISLKASSVPITILAYRLMAERVDYPFHIGITESGTLKDGSIKSAVGIGTLLAEGIGDTIRVSLTGDPLEEVRVGYKILKALNLRPGIDLISCPSCGRCEIDLFKIVTRLDGELSTRYPLSSTRGLKIAVMGCVVNGPGEAREADIGLAAGKGSGLIFTRGKIIKKVKEEEMFKALLDEVEKRMVYLNE